MKFKSNSFIPIFSFTLLFCLCIHNTNAQIGSLGGFHNIHLEEKGELALSYGFNLDKRLGYQRLKKYFHYSLLDKTNINEFEGGYSFGKYLAIQAGYHRLKILNRPYSSFNSSYYFGSISFETLDSLQSTCQFIHTESEIWNDTKFYKIAVGVYKRFDFKKSLFFQYKKRNYRWMNKAGLLIDFYVGYGKGINQTNHFVEINNPAYCRGLGLSSASILNFQQYYIQPSVSLNGNFAGFKFLTIYGLMDFDKIKILGKVSNSTDELVDELSDNNKTSIYGLSFNLWLGIKQVKLMYSFNKKIFGSNKSIYLNHSAAFRNYSDLLSIQLKWDIVN